MSRTLSRSFGGGEISPELFGRIDLDKMQTGLSKCLNMFVRPHGPVKSRPGMRFVNYAKYNNRKCRMVRFQFSADDAVFIELGHLYARFHLNGQTLLEPSHDITSVTTDGTGVIINHGVLGTALADGDTVFIEGSTVPELNGAKLAGTASDGSGRFFNVEYLSQTSFYLKDQFGNYISTSAVTIPGSTAAGSFARVHEVATDFLEEDLFDLRHSQSLDVVTFTSNSYPPAKLSRTLNTVTNSIEWIYEVEDFDLSSSIASPDRPTATSAGYAGSDAYYVHSYVVTAVSDDGKNESIASVPNCEAANNATNKIMAITQLDAVTDYAVFDLAALNLEELDEVVLTDMPAGWTDLEGGLYAVNSVVDAATDKYTLMDSNGEVIKMGIRAAFSSSPSYARKVGYPRDLTLGTGTTIRLTWPQVAGITRYRVYKRTGYIYAYGYVGETSAPRFVDNNITPDVSKTPPESTNYFESDYPAAVAYFEQRKVFAGTTDRPQTAWLTKPYTEKNLSTSFPLRSDDAIMANARSNEGGKIMHAVSLNDIVLLTSGGEMRLGTLGGEALTPATITIKAQSYVGASPVQPVMSNRAAIFVEVGGKALRELVYKGDIDNTYESQNISVMAPHLFESPVVDLAFMRGKEPMVFAVREDGYMVGMSYMPEQRVLAFHQHNTDGLIESACSCTVPAGDIIDAPGNELYLSVKRTVNGVECRTIERIAADDDTCYMDCAMVYSGAATSVIQGLWAFEGETLQVVADNGWHQSVTVADGYVTLDAECTTVVLGRSYTQEMRTLPQLFDRYPAFGIGAIKNVSKAFIRVAGDGGISVGQVGEQMVDHTLRDYDTMTGIAASLGSTVIEVPIVSAWTDDGSIAIVNENSRPVTIISIAYEFSING